MSVTATDLEALVRRAVEQAMADRGWRNGHAADAPAPAVLPAALLSVAPDAQLFWDHPEAVQHAVLALMTALATNRYPTIAQ